MVTVWRLRRNVIRTVLYCQCATSSMDTVYKNSSYNPVGPWVRLVGVFRLHDLFYQYTFWYVLFYLGQLIHFLSCLGAGVTKLKEPPSSFLFPITALRHPLSIVNKKQCETRKLFMSLIIHCIYRRRTRLPGCIRLRNGVYCVRWGRYSYSLSLASNMTDIDQH